MPDVIRLKIKRQDSPEAKSYWEEFEIPYRAQHNVISVLMTLRENPDYPLLLSEWIIEAAIGLGYGSDGGGILQDRTEIRIRCIPDDRELLKMGIPGIKERFLALTGRSIKLVFDETNLSRESIGIILFDETGRTAFSNTLADRFRRASQDVHRLVMERMFPGSYE